ncbi:hypothetical protein [Sphingomonas sp. CFBP 13720]|uniref:hypothetical protein n=1 Tax=Sphingomonas sp. CFBP 13720 TaxID=2775302 RepID=UPI00177C4B14|nr:hypothetical protein [Sphingomonas sp. CFBP 13720]MBD8679264.1 hypothetical protein [Sphingomonas sp. CFBP 13720]
MTRLVALCAIVRTPADSAPTQFAGFDAEGNSIIQAVSEEIKPGTIFEETNETEVEWLLANNAVRLPNDREIQMFDLVGELPSIGGR